SISIPVPARSADSDVAQVIPAAPRSWTATTRPPARISSVASITSFSANGSPTWTEGRFDGSWSPNVALASTDAPPIPSRPVAEPDRTTTVPTPSAAAARGAVQHHEVAAAVGRGAGQHPVLEQPDRHHVDQRVALVRRVEHEL